MSLNDEKLSRFEAIIFEEINEKIKEIDREVDSLKNDELKKAETLARSQSEATLSAKKAKISSANKQEVTKASLSVRQSLLKRRAEITDQVFENASKKLLAFADNTDYKDFLFALLEKALRDFPKSETTALLREKDLAFKDEIEDKFAVNVETDKTNLLGGFILKNQTSGLLSDHTLNTHLYEQKTAFIKQSGMFIDYTADSLAQ